MITRNGDWIQTFTGKQFYPLDPRPEEVCIDDIAHSLAMKCRYAGHTRRFYSVAEHSVHISYSVPRKHALWGLLHDAAEAYSSDIPTPLKRWPGLQRVWAEIEGPIQLAICAKFNLPALEPDEVRIADRRILVNECLEFMMFMPESLKRIPPLPKLEGCIGWSPPSAEHEFLRRFEELYRG